MPGQLFIVATPIGHLSDITLRAIETLKSVDLIACEDTRRTEKLTNHLGLKKPLIRYDEHTHGAASQRLLNAIVREGKSVALVTDAGTPCISDPGARLVAAAVDKGIAVVPIPGPSSVMAALSVSGFPARDFIFLGFLSRRAGPASRALREATGLGKTVVLFESPFRVVDTLKLISEIDPSAPVAIGREITKIHEEFIRGRADHVVTEFESRPQKGEVVIVIGPTSGAKPEEWNSEHEPNRT